MTVSQTGNMERKASGCVEAKLGGELDKFGNAWPKVRTFPPFLFARNAMALPRGDISISKCFCLVSRRILSSRYSRRLGSERPSKRREIKPCGRSPQPQDPKKKPFPV